MKTIIEGKLENLAAVERERERERVYLYSTKKMSTQLHKGYVIKINKNEQNKNIKLFSNVLFCVHKKYAKI